MSLRNSCIAFSILLLSSAHFIFAQTETTQLRIYPYFKNLPLTLDSGIYSLTGKDTLSIKTFKFYISQITLYSKNKLVYKESNSYHLMDAEDTSSLHIVLAKNKIRAFDEIRFLIGVDSIANVSGALDGDLDPGKGMFWAWNTGYIAAKLEGVSNVCNTLHHAFEFHIGGYLSPYNASRNVTLPIPSTPHIDIVADISKWFDGKQIIDLSTVHTIVIPCAAACQMADNYAYMFRLK